MTHTQGPWRCYPNHGFPEEFRVYDENDNWLTEDEEEREKIANLIAASPLLLAALIELDQHLQASGAEYPQGTFETVQAAIKAAT